MPWFLAPPWTIQSDQQRIKMALGLEDGGPNFEQPKSRDATVMVAMDQLGTLLLADRSPPKCKHCSLLRSERGTHVRPILRKVKGFIILVPGSRWAMKGVQGKTTALDLRKRCRWPRADLLGCLNKV